MLLVAGVCESHDSLLTVKLLSVELEALMHPVVFDFVDVDGDEDVAEIPLAGMTGDDCDCETSAACVVGNVGAVGAGAGFLQLRIINLSIVKWN